MGLFVKKLCHFQKILRFWFSPIFQLKCKSYSKEYLNHRVLYYALRKKNIILICVIFFLWNLEENRLLIFFSWNLRKRIFVFFAKFRKIIPHNFCEVKDSFLIYFVIFRIFLLTFFVFTLSPFRTQIMIRTNCYLIQFITTNNNNNLMWTQQRLTLTTRVPKKYEKLGKSVLVLILAND